MTCTAGDRRKEGAKLAHKNIITIRRLKAGPERCRGHHPMQNHRLFWVAVVRFGAFPILRASCRKSFLKLRSDWAGCRFPPKLWANPACGLCMARQLGPRCACRPSHWPWPPAIVQGCSWLPSMCLAWAITPRAPSADRLCASERREQKTRWHSLSLEVSMAAARSKVGILQPGCPRIALASCPARAVHRLTDHCPCADNV